MVNIMVDFPELRAAVRTLGFDTREEETTFVDYLTVELEVQVGAAISEGLSGDLLSEFDRIKDPEVGAEWLEKNRPDYRMIVENKVTDIAEGIVRHNQEIMRLWRNGKIHSDRELSRILSGNIGWDLL